VSLRWHPAGCSRFRLGSLAPQWPGRHNIYILKAKDVIKRYYDKKYINFRFKISDSIILYKKNISFVSLSKKLNIRYEELFIIISI
jgi:hypothetical protein